MKAKANDTKARKIMATTLAVAVASVYMLLAAAPALAFGVDPFDPVGLDQPTKGGPQTDEPLVVDGVYLDLIVQLEGFGEDEPEGGSIPDGGDWEMCPEDDGPVIPDGGDWEMGPDTPDFPEIGDDDAVTPGPEYPGQEDEPDQPDDSDESTDTPEIPEDEPEDEPGDDTPYLPFTGGNAAGFLVAGLGLGLAGVGVIGASRKRRS